MHDTREADTQNTWAAGLPLPRRQFLKLLGGGIVVTFFVGDWSLLEAQRREYPADFNAYLRVGEDGRVTIYSGKVELGQGVMTSLAQMAAEELGVPLGSIEMVMGDTRLCPWDMGTFGSMSTRFFGPPLRGAAAEAKAVLLELAAERLQVSAASLRVTNGVITAPGKTSRRVTFGELARGKRIERHLSGKPKLRASAEFTTSGKPTPRLDAVPKATGRAQYAADLRLPGMLAARVLHPPAHGATLKTVDVSAAEHMPGVTVVQRDGLVAVLSPDSETATRALAAVRATWDTPAATVDDESIFDRLIEQAPPPQERERKGDVAAGERAATTLFEHRYENGYGAHAPMEPHAALASFTGDEVTVWAATQTPFPDQQTIAQALGIAPERVRVITPFVGGGFGGKSGACLQSVEAAKLARIVGKPVQVMWTRAEEFFYDRFRPAAVVRIKSGLDGAGKLVLWDYQVYGAGARSSEQFYDVPHHLIRVYGQWGRGESGVHPFATGPWRAPGANINVFARESQIDIMAAKARRDPLAFRLANTSDPRMRRVLERGAERFGWRPAASPSGHGVGLACGIDAGTYVAMFAAVEVDRGGGAVRVRRIACAQDMGQVVNPDGALMQMEGCIAMGLGYALSEELRFRGGEVLDRNFDTYRVPRFSDLPEIDAFLVSNDELAPQGGGEPAIVPVGAAIANAICDATGARVFRMPMTPERVKKALGES